MTLNNLPYFAYGSNLNAPDWAAYCEKNRKTCGPLRSIGRAIAPDFRLVFGKHSAGRNGGVADIRPAVGHVVEGVLFRLTPDQRAVLDRKEGAPVHYEPIMITVLTETGQAVQAMTYRVTAAHSRSHVEPHPDYLAVMTAGLAENGLAPDTPALAAAAQGRLSSRVGGVFVYGSLRAMGSWAQILADAPRQAAQVRGRLALCGSYPGLIPGEGMVQGEFVQVADMARVIETLDRIEGYDPTRKPQDNLFQRKLITLVDAAGARHLAWTYAYAQPHASLPVIPSGDWSHHLGQGQSPAPLLHDLPDLFATGLNNMAATLPHLQTLCDRAPHVLAALCPPTRQDHHPYWRGGEVLVVPQDFPQDTSHIRDMVLRTPFAAEVTGLFRLCQMMIDAGPGHPSLRAAYGAMAEAILRTPGDFHQHSRAALEAFDALIGDLSHTLADQA